MFWVPRHPSSLREAIKWKETVVHLAHLQILCVLVAFNPTSFKKWLGGKKMIESEADLKHFCRGNSLWKHPFLLARNVPIGEERGEMDVFAGYRDKGLVTWFEMKSRGWDRELKFSSKRQPFWLDKSKLDRLHRELVIRLPPGFLENKRVQKMIIYIRNQCILLSHKVSLTWIHSVFCWTTLFKFNFSGSSGVIIFKLRLSWLRHWEIFRN